MGRGDPDGGGLLHHRALQEHRGNIFQQNFGNTTAGILFNGSRNSVAGDFHASYIGQAGIIVRNSPGARLFNFSAVGNAESGVWLDRSDDGTISTESAAGNGKYGMLGPSRNVVIDCNGTAGNGDTGILLGCGSTKCEGVEYSDQNRITNSGAPGKAANGILIEKKNNGNIITITHNDGNPDHHDMVDLNNNCGTNVWYNNTGTGNQSCVK
jgi:hypothetical protein